MQDETQICKVCIPGTYGDVYDYQLIGEPLLLGSRVLVPFRNTQRLGFVWSYGDSVLNKPLKNIIVGEQIVVFDAAFRKFCELIAAYYHAPLSEVLALALPKYSRDMAHLLDRITQVFIDLAPHLDRHATVLKRSKKLNELVQYLLAIPRPVLEKDLILQGFPKPLLQKAIEKQLCYKKLCAIEAAQFSGESIELNQEQKMAVSKVIFTQFGVYVLQGVTGSGKTEVYAELMRTMISMGKQVLILVPEIGLTLPVLERLRQRLGVPVILMHSSLSDKQRYEHWLQGYHQQAQVFLGTRSAIFANLPALGLIIVDEEHDVSFRQFDGVRYSAKDAAVMRAKLLNIPIILGSATPSLETLHNLDLSKYQLLRLNHKALTQQALYYQVIDLRHQKIEHGLTEKTLSIMQRHLQAGEQVLVFMNRRGYAPLIFCHACGWAKKCSNCDAFMTWHWKRQLLLCHHCGAQAKVPKTCESCHGENLQAMGVGTERLYEYLSQYFTTFRCLRFDRDVVKNRELLQDSLNKITQRDVDIIIGTQMLAKGHHFSHLGLVVVVDADSAFYQTDFRAMERLGQILMQVAGRAGREHIAGEVIIQTHLPSHPLLLTLLQQGYDVFSKSLMRERKSALLPPYAYLGLVRVQGKNNLNVQQYAACLRALVSDVQLSVLGPAPAPMEKKAGLFHWQLLLKAQHRKNLHQGIQCLEHYIKQYPSRGVRCFIEIDPYDC